MLSCCPQVSTFIMMYRTHCQRILDTVIRANFDEARLFLLLTTHQHIFCVSRLTFSDLVLINVWKWKLLPPILSFTSCVASAGPKLPAALLAGHAAPHAPCPRLPHGGEHRRCLWLHPVQGHLWGPDAHRPASTAGQVSLLKPWPLLRQTFVPFFSLLALKLDVDPVVHFVLFTPSNK